MLNDIIKRHKVKTADIRVVAIDDTNEWHEDTQKAGGKIKTVYYFDASQITHCCEITPSYLLYPLYAFTENEVSEEIKEALDYGIHVENPEPRYFHCSEIDAIAEKKGFSHHLDGGLRYYAPDGKKHREIMDAAYEYFSGNVPY